MKTGFALCVSALALTAGTGVSARPSPAVAQKPAQNYAQEAVVIEQARAAVRFEKDGTGRREIYMRLRTQSEAGVQQWGQLVFGYNSANERPEIAFVRVKKPDGTVVTTPSDAVQDLSSPVQRIAPVYTDFRQKHVTVQSLRPGDTLEFSVITTTHTPLAPGQFWTEYEFQKDAILLDEQLDIDVPADYPVKLKTRIGFDPTIKDAAGRRIYHWTSSHLVREDPDAKDAKKPAPSEPEPPAVRLTTFQNWEQVGQWYAALERSQLAPTPEIRQKAEELTKGRSTDLEKLEALYGFVATNFRYVSLSLGAGRYQPRSAAEVLREQYGDCKDKHTLLASLIDAAGMRASAVLINSRLKLDPDFPSPSQFDHVITRATVGREEVWLDATTEVAPFRLLAFPLRKKQALVVEQTGPAHLEETPSNPPYPDSVVQDIEGTLGDTGKLTARVRMSFRGDPELLLRTIFRATPAADWKQMLEQITRQQGIDGDVSDWKVSDPAATKDPFTIEYSVAAARFVDSAKKTIDVPLPFANVTLPDVTDDEPGDSSPVKLGPPGDISYKLKLQLPSASRPRLPLPVTVTRDYADYRGAYSLNGTTFTAERVLRQKESELPSTRRQDYLAFSRVVATDSRQRLSIESTAPAASETVPAELKARELNQSGYDALQQGNYAQAVTLFKRVIELDPKDKTAWINLGRAHLALKQNDEAIAAFRKQTELNPYDEYAYNSLGAVYVIQRKYDEAEAAFQKQIELNPLDKYAHAGLGTMYLERKQYDRAAGELEKAAALVPDNAQLRIEMGKAYLGLKRNEDAAAAFDKAVELSPTPLTWNNIAYELSLRSVNLDRAQQYAESAVAATTAASRNLDVEHADGQALGVVSSLGAYWDTLGWVHFARGDVNTAEKFVAAAWGLSQHAEVGDHLAQIYEKLGRRNEAIKMYTLALAAERPADDISEHLALLVGTKKVDGDLNARRTELAQLRTLPLSVKGPKGDAEFFVLMSSASGVEGVKFASGSEALRPLGDALKAIKPSRIFPDDAPAKILRRGILSCPSSGACAFTLLLPEEARPLK